MHEEERGAATRLKDCCVIRVFVGGGSAKNRKQYEIFFTWVTVGKGKNRQMGKKGGER